MALDSAALLTLGEAVALLERQVSRSTLERAIAAGELPARRGRGKAGKPAYLVARDDVLRWYDGRAGVLAGRAGDDDDDDDDVLAGAHDAGRPDVALERLSATLRDVQAGAVGEVSRQLEPLWDRLASAHERIGRLESENAQLRQRVWECEQGPAPKRRRFLRWW